MYDSYDPSDNFVINILPAKIDKVDYLIENAEQKRQIFCLVTTIWSDEKVLSLKI